MIMHIIQVVLILQTCIYMIPKMSDKPQKKSIPRLCKTQIHLSCRRFYIKISSAYGKKQQNLFYLLSEYLDGKRMVSEDTQPSVRVSEQLK